MVQRAAEVQIQMGLGTGLVDYWGRKDLVKNLAGLAQRVRKGLEKDLEGLVQRGRQGLVMSLVS